MALAAALARARLSLRPPPKMRLSQWAEATIKLPEGASALPGRLRLFPYQREIADAIGNPALERVTLVKSVRVGFTMLLSAAAQGAGWIFDRALDEWRFVVATPLVESEGPLWVYKRLVHRFHESDLLRWVPFSALYVVW